jgi:hypothetical protein
VEKLNPDDIRAYYWSKGKLDYLLRPHQDRIEKAFLESKERVFVQEVGRQVGKTFWNSKKAVEVCLNIPHARVKYASAFQNSVEEYVMPNLRLVLNDCPPHLRPKPSKTERKYEFKNGSELKLIGLDKQPDAGRGPYCDLYIIDEAGFVRTLGTILDDVIRPMFNTRPWGRIILSSSSPKTPGHPFIAYAEKFKDPEHYSYIMMTIDDNLDLTRERIEEIKKEYDSQNSMRRELYCERIIDESLAIVPEWKEEYCKETRPDEFRQFYYNYTFMDLGVKNDYTAGLLAYYDFQRAKLVIEDEFGMKGPDMTTLKLANLIKQKEKERFSFPPFMIPKVFRRVADNDNLLLVQDLSAMYKLSTQATDKSALVSMVNKVRIWMGRGLIEIHPRCRNLLGCLRTGIWDEQRKKFDHSPVFGHFDWLSALIYGVRNTDTVTNPIPNTYGFNLALPGVIVIPEKKKTILKRFGE